MPMKFGILTVIALGTVVTACNADHAVDSDRAGNAQPEVSPVRNLIAINRRNEVLWNSHPVTLDQLKANLEQTRALPVEPELQFVPDMQASYDVSAEVLNIIKDANVTKLGFVGNEKDVTPGRD